ncbi:type 1 glutamine amidotransferase [Streptosporangium sp. NPDC048047]|uniref:gamma-glutamyl-gamma-aminobutyrate hydrolase family protein n=1 Tax=Streptosporangium sp. NPDC048047 TaxID=3155748 RepID=UPI003431EE61
MPRPLIGITSYLEAARWGDWVREAVLSPAAYTRAVERAGGVPVLLPPLTPAVAAEHARHLSGVLLTGGGEIDPTLYGAARDKRLGEPQHRRDRFELALARAAVQAGLPLLGVARGMHVLNVAQGGSLIPWLPDAVDNHELHTGGGHVVQVSASSRLGEAVGDRVETTAPHRQAIRRIGAGLTPVAWADDQIVEGVELRDHPFGVGVQWHPERDDGDRLVAALVEAATRFGTGTRPGAGTGGGAETGTGARPGARDLPDAAATRPEEARR